MSTRLKKVCDCELIAFLKLFSFPFLSFPFLSSPLLFFSFHFILFFLQYVWLYGNGLEGGIPAGMEGLGSLLEFKVDQAQLDASDQGVLQRMTQALRERSLVARAADQ